MSRLPTQASEEEVYSEEEVRKAFGELISGLADVAEACRLDYLDGYYEPIAEDLRFLHPDLIGDDWFDFRDRVLGELRAGGGRLWTATRDRLRLAGENGELIDDPELATAIRKQAARDDEAAAKAKQAAFDARIAEAYERSTAKPARDAARKLNRAMPTSNAAKLLDAYWTSVDGVRLRYLWRVSRPAGFHRQPLSERCVNLSAHTAPIRQTC